MWQRSLSFLWPQHTALVSYLFNSYHNKFVIYSYIHSYLINAKLEQNRRGHGKHAVWFDTVCRLAHHVLVVPLCAGRRYAPPCDRCRGDLSLCSALIRAGLPPNKVTIEHGAVGIVKRTKNTDQV